MLTVLFIFKLQIPLGAFITGLISAGLLATNSIIGTYRTNRERRQEKFYTDYLIPQLKQLYEIKDEIANKERIIGHLLDFLGNGESNFNPNHPLVSSKTILASSHNLQGAVNISIAEEDYKISLKDLLI